MHKTSTACLVMLLGLSLGIVLYLVGSGAAALMHDSSSVGLELTTLSSPVSTRHWEPNTTKPPGFLSANTTCLPRPLPATIPQSLRDQPRLRGSTYTDNNSTHIYVMPVMDNVTVVDVVDVGSVTRNMSYTVYTSCTRILSVTWNNISSLFTWILSVTWNNISGISTRNR